MRRIRFSVLFCVISGLALAGCSTELQQAEQPVTASSGVAAPQSAPGANLAAQDRQTLQNDRANDQQVLNDANRALRTLGH